MPINTTTLQMALIGYEAERRKIEAKIILNALHANNWNRKKAARSLDISYRALLYKLKDVGIPTRRSLSAPKHTDDKAQS